MAAMTTLVCLLIGYPFAWALSKVGKQRQLILIFLLIVPFWTNSLVRTYALKLILATNGLLNSALMSIGLIDEPLQLLDHRRRRAANGRSRALRLRASCMTFGIPVGFLPHSV